MSKSLTNCDWEAVASRGAVGCRAKAEMQGDAARCESIGAVQRGSPSTDAPVGNQAGLDALVARGGGGARRGSTTQRAPVVEAAARRG